MLVGTQKRYNHQKPPAGGDEFEFLISYFGPPLLNNKSDPSWLELR
jgi:hypothetical protein